MTSSLGTLVGLEVFAGDSCHPLGSVKRLSTGAAYCSIGIGASRLKGFSQAGSGVVI